MEFFATCVAGLEPILGQELRSLGMQKVRPLTGGVSFDDDLQAAYRALLWSRVASRIQLVLARIDAGDSDMLYMGARAIHWEDHISPEATIAVTARGTNEQLRDSRFTALRVKDAICDRLRELRHGRPDVDSASPDLLIRVHLRSRRATVSLDLSGTSLEDRGYRDAARTSHATIHETLAAAALLACDWPRLACEGGVLIDPNCASGTLCIEAALLAADIAPAITRSRWGFEKWSGHDEDEWIALLSDADKRAQNGPQNAKVIAFDQRKDELLCAQARAKSAGVAKHVRFVSDEKELHNAISRQSGGTLLSCNLLSSAALPAALRPARLASIAARALSYNTIQNMLILSEDKDAEAYLGLPQVFGFESMNGSTPCFASILDVSSGTTRRFAARVCDTRIAVHDKGAQQFADRLNKVAKQCRKWAKKTGVHAYRIYDADLPDYNMAIDIYEGAAADFGKTCVHVAEYAPPKYIDEKKAACRMADALAIVAAVLDVPACRVFTKRRVRSRGGSQYGKQESSATPFEAIESSGKLITCENGLLFEVDLASYLDTGLFLDHRDVRALVGKLVSGKSFLNLFSYTCSASVYAAHAGAKSTTSIDLSNTYLQWGKRNIQLNGLMDRNQEFVRADCVSWVGQTRHTKKRWDLVFIDPPTFSNSAKMGKGDWEVQRDHVELLIGASRLLARDGVIVFSCNLRGFAPDMQALSKAGVRIVDITPKTIPQDFSRNAKIHHCYLLRRI